MRQRSPDPPVPGTVPPIMTDPAAPSIIAEAGYAWCAPCTLCAPAALIQGGPAGMAAHRATVHHA